MALTKNEKIHAIVHGAAASAAAVGAGMAQIPGSDYLALMPIQAAMIASIALVHNRKLTEATATGIAGTLGATFVGRTVTQVLVGWIPGVGNAINATTAAGLTEAVGWFAHKLFENLGDEPFSDEEIIARAKKMKK